MEQRKLLVPKPIIWFLLIVPFLVMLIAAIFARELPIDLRNFYSDILLITMYFTGIGFLIFDVLKNDVKNKYVWVFSFVFFGISVIGYLIRREKILAERELRKA